MAAVGLQSLICCLLFVAVVVGSLFVVALPQDAADNRRQLTL